MPDRVFQLIHLRCIKNIFQIVCQSVLKPFAIVAKLIHHFMLCCRDTFSSPDRLWLSDRR